MAGLYVHVPFCRAKCHYCDFASTADLSSMEAFHRALDLELSLTPVLSPIKTVYFGGGTPSLLGPEGFRSWVKICQKHVDFSSVEEFTVEVNPESATRAFLEAAKEAGVNRLSIGLQTLDDGLLKTLGRRHDRATFEGVYHLARALGFGNISVDLMIGLPGQSPSHLEKTLEGVLALSPEHLSIYSLKVEEGTVFHQRGIQEEEVLDRKMDHLVEKRLTQAGYIRYELSNYALPGKESRHNSDTWRLVPYMGLGPGAHSDDGTIRCANTPSIKTYLEALFERGEKPLVDCQKVDAKERVFEAMILGLRLREGVDVQAIADRFGIDPVADHLEEVLDAQESGLLLYESGRILLTPKGRDLSNQVMMIFA